jgi:hypothetical protein
MLNQNTHIYIFWALAIIFYEFVLIKYLYLYIVSLVKYTWHTSSQLSITIFVYFGQRQGQIMQYDSAFYCYFYEWNFPLDSKAY